MKLALIIVLVGVALCQMSTVEGFIGGWGLGRGFIGGPWGLGGWGGPWGPWGGLGWGGFGWGRGFGFGGFRGGFGGFRGGFGGRGFRGRRDIDGVHHHNRTFCSISSKSNILTCHGVKYDFECDLIPTYTDLATTSYNVHNLTVVPNVVTVDKVDQQVYNLFSHKIDTGAINRFTLIDKPSTKVTFSVYRSEKVGENGWRVTDGECWKSFETMVRESRPEQIKFRLFLNNIKSTTV